MIDKNVNSDRVRISRRRTSFVGESVAENTHARKKYIHISFDDVCSVWKDITEYKYASVFEHTLLADLKKLHSTYGAVFTLNCFNEAKEWSIMDIPNTYKKELSENAAWLKFAFHAQNSTSKYTSDCVESIKDQYNTFLTSIINAAGENSIDRITRLGFFTGSENNIKALKDCKYGIKGILTADDDRRDNYYLSADERAYIGDHDMLYDEINDMLLITSQTRLENIITPDLMDAELTKFQQQDRRIHMLELFTHESEYEKVKETMRKYCEWAINNGYEFDYAENHLNELLEAAKAKPMPSAEIADKVYSLVLDSSGDKTTVNTSMLDRNAYVSTMQITTADEKGRIVKQYQVDLADRVTIDTRGAVKIEIAPVYSYKLDTSFEERKALDGYFPDGTYHLSIVKGDANRSGDIYVNDAMVANNVYFTGYHNTGVTEEAYRANDIVISGGSISLQIKDSTTFHMKSCEIVKSPEIVKRKPKIWVIGDSLVQKYYGKANPEVNGQRGWGQFLENFLTDDVEVVNLANAGHFAKGLAETALTGVIANGKEGDYFIIEGGYNDYKHYDEKSFYQYTIAMVKAAKQQGIIPILVSPNASLFYDDKGSDFNPVVRYSEMVKKAADDTGAYYVDLAELSYRFYCETYGTDDYAKAAILNTYYFVDLPDDHGLHHNYIGAMKWAEVVVNELYRQGILNYVDLNYEYQYTDYCNNTITLRVKNYDLYDIW